MLATFPEEPEVWQEANRIILGWGPAMPRVRRREASQWQGCKATRQDGYACLGDPGARDMCWRQFPGGDRPQEPQPFDTYIYFIEGDGLIKIGKTKRPPRNGELPRFRDIQWQCPTPLRLLRIIWAPVTLEKALHWEFKEDRRWGECFTDTPRLREWIALNDEDLLCAAGVFEAGVWRDQRKWARWLGYVKAQFDA